MSGIKFLAALASSLPLAAQTYTITTIAGGSPAPASAPATSLALNGLGRVGMDPSGNVYFTALNSVFALSPSGAVTRLAGNGRPGFSGDGGPATSAQLNSPTGVVLDTLGNIYISDTGNQRIRIVTNGIISTFAGTGTPGASGDYGPPTSAQLDEPIGLAVDTSGNLYIADSANNVIREISGGIIFPFAGDYINGYANDGDPAIDAALSEPSDIAFDNTGAMYIADTGNARIRQVGTTGFISTLVGGGTTYTEGGLATATQLTGPKGVALDSALNIYIADGDANRIYKVTQPAGDITTITGVVAEGATVTGSATYGFSGDGGSAANAVINTPVSIQVDPTGDLFFVDLNNWRVREIAASGTINTVAGNGQTTYSGDGGSAENALMSAPSGVAFAPGGVVYIADTNNQRIRQVSNGIISTVAGNGTPGFTGDGGAATSAELAYPSGLALDAAGNLYISDTTNQRVRKLSGGTIATVAGNGTSGYSGDGGAATSATLNSPAGLAVDSAGNLYIADFSNNVVRKVTSGGTISTIAGTGLAGYGGDGGAAVQALLNGPNAVALDASGDVYVADSGNHVIREITPGGTISTFAGNGVAATSGDGGLAVNAQLAVPAAVAVDGQGNVYIADSSANRIRVVTTAGVIETIAGGSSSPGYSGDNGPAVNAQFNGPAAISLDPSGDVYVADRNNNAIRFMQSISSVPTVGAVTNGASGLTGPIAPAELVTIWGTGLGPSTLANYQPNSNGYIPTNTGGTTVYVNGVLAPVVYAWSNQVGILVPYESTPGPGLISVVYGGAVSLQLPVTIAPTSPGLFTADYTGVGQALAINPDGSVNTTSSPVPAGQVIYLYATGYGLVTPPVPDGAPNNPGFGTPLLPVTATVNGQAAIVQRASGYYNLPEGTIQLWVVVPTGISGSAVPVAISIGGVQSQPGVTIAVQ
jgi:trimeric autotransporter adhesin